MVARRGRDDVLDREHGVVEARERGLADAGKQFCEARTVAEVHADHGGFLEHPHEIRQLRPVVPGDRHPTVRSVPSVRLASTAENPASSPMNAGGVVLGGDVAQRAHDVRPDGRT